MKVRNGNVRFDLRVAARAVATAVLAAALLVGGAISAPTQAAAAPGHARKVVSGSSAKAARYARHKARAKAAKAAKAARYRRQVAKAKRAAKIRAAKAKAKAKSARKAVKATAVAGGWRSARVSWYGPGFYGHGMAGGGILRLNSMVVAHKTLPFGTLIDFTFQGKTVRAVVRDRGPFVRGREFDLGPGTAVKLGFDHVGVGTVQYKIVGRI